MNTELILKEGFQEYIVDTDTDIYLNIIANKTSDLLIRIINAKSISIFSDINNEGNITILFWNESNNKILFNEKYEVGSNSDLKIAYGDLNGADIERSTVVNLNGPNASSLVKSATLCKNKKH